MNCKVIAKGAAHLMVKRFMWPFWIRRQWLKKTQWLSAGELEQIQLRLLKRLVLHCYKTVPYYHQLMDEQGITVESIKTLDDIKRFPILRKEDVLTAGDKIVSTKYPKWTMTSGRTGGTTGTPLLLPRSLFSLGNEHAFVRRQWDWAGIGFLDNTAYLSGRVIVDANKIKGRLYAYDPFMRELVLSTYHLSAETARQFIEAMKHYRVKAVIGYTSSICFLAKTCLDLDRKFKLKAALTTSETINEYMRATISEAFGCKVFDFYGAAERVCYIFTCECGSYHIIPEYGLTELVPIENSDNSQCKIIATGFWSFGMPLLRYDIGDIVTASRSKETCVCGRAFPIIKSICGRTGDLIRTPSGREYGPTLMARVAKGVNNILQSQIIQDKIDHITILYVPSRKFTEMDLFHFRKHMRHHLPSELKMHFKRVSAVEKTKSGKINFLVSKLKSDK
jgi:phenylacetate-CoA ligase